MKDPFLTYDYENKKYSFIRGDDHVEYDSAEEAKTNFSDEFPGPFLFSYIVYSKLIRGDFDLRMQNENTRYEDIYPYLQYPHKLFEIELSD